MELSNKEKKVQQVLSDINYDIDTDFLWKEVNNELNKKKRRKFLWFIPFGIFGLFGIVYIFSIQEINQNKGISDATTNEIHTDIIKIENNKTTIENNDPPLAINNNNSQSTTLNAKYSNSTEVPTQQTAIKNNLSTTKPAFNIFKSNNPTSNYFAINSEKYIPSKSLVRKESKLPSNNYLVDGFAQLTNLKAITGITFSMFQYARDSKLIGNENLESIEVKNLESRRYFVSIGIGAIQNITSTNTTTGEFSGSYFDKEVQLPAINVSALMGIETKNHWRFFGGFDYAQLITRYQNNETEIITGLTPIEDQETINTSGSYETNEGNLTTTTQIDNDITWHNRHYQYNLQIGLSKDLLANQRFSIAPELSLIQNIYTSHKGYYFTQEEPHFQTFTEREENPYRKNNGLNTQLALNLAYQLGGFEFSINTAWRNPINAITTETNFYQTKNSQLSIQARVNYLLNWENK